jgi:NADH-quinone oxidoreductase subunit N
MTVLSLSVLGMPPLSGLLGQVLRLRRSGWRGYWMVARRVWSASVVAAFYYLRMIKLMWFDAAP